MPPVQALGLHLSDYDGERLTISAPIAANHNDKNNAFGGSLASAATLAAWALCSMKLLEAGFDADVYVQDTMIRYLAPLYDDLHAVACLAEGQTWDSFLAAFASKQRARATLVVQMLDGDGNTSCTLEGRFVAKARSKT
jgi:thioesterase domain-containing protein